MLHIILPIIEVTLLIAAGASFFVLANGWRKKYVEDLFCGICWLGMWTCICSGAVWGIWDILSWKG